MFKSHEVRESELIKLIEEKKLWLNEIHHRVKNSLQLSSSLISLKFDDFDNEEMKEVILTLNFRLMAISKLHDTLQVSKHSSELNMSLYINSIVSSFRSQFSIKMPVDINVSIPDDFFISVKYGHCIGIIVAELLSNSVKHAFEKNNPQGAVIHICFEFPESNNDMPFLSFQDNGKGFDYDWSQQPDSFGLKLIYLFSKQLSASLSSNQCGGFNFKLSSPYFVKKSFAVT